MNPIFFVLDVILAGLTLFYSAFIVFHLVSWNRLTFDGKSKNNLHTKISILIPSRNEEKNIGKCLASILAQDYPKELMEIIVCNDQSGDDTKNEALKVLESSGINYQYISATSLPSNKKKAIEGGIKASSGQLILLTDADCTAEKTWVSSMVNSFEESHAKMLCGPVALTDEKKLCEKFQGLEMCGLSILSGAGINLGIPLLCNGANIAYTREAFEAVEGFKGIDELPTGDDTLLLFKIASKFPGSINYVKTGEAFVYSTAQHSWKEFFQQRIRWASKGLQSKNTLNSSVSLLVFLSNFLLLVCGILTFVYPPSILIFLICLAVKSAVDFLLLTFGSVFFRKTKLLLYFLIFEIITMFYTSLVGFIAPFSRYQWKGRNY
ncbi:MAG TPA: glycosyltransferase [Bacteroidia bacterium]|jgi:cellulose synthase/poly-beta-1,6-N-acetylglucosamine synthase-like glycosyltransferase|nr:glycosyltransferase [Bacteroidia bacterium]